MHLSIVFPFCHSCILFSCSLQECDEGAAAKESLRAFGYNDLHVAIRGGASFTHESRSRNFLSLLKNIWFQEYKYSSVTLVWAGNDLTNYYSTPESLTQAVEDVMQLSVSLTWWVRDTSVAEYQMNQLASINHNQIE